MKIERMKNNERKKVRIKEKVSLAEKYVVLAYLFCMLGILPLYYQEQYYQIGNAKLEFFWTVSLCFIGISCVLAFTKMVDRKGKNWCDFLNQLSPMDFAVFVYGICVLLSYGFSDYKEFGFKGAVGWEMGLCAQLFFVAIYFILSRKRLWGKGSLCIHFFVSALVFILGILHRFDIDPLKMYVGLDVYQKIEFLSTIGQATWFSGYVCTVFAVGVAVFYISNHKKTRIFTGIYTVISFGILVTQNSDSAFMAIGGILLLLGYFSVGNIEKWCRFWQIMSLMWGTFAGMGILQKIFWYRAIPLDNLSIFFSQSPMTWLLFLACLGILVYYTNQKNRKKETTGRLMQITKSVYKVFLLLLAVIILGIMVFIYLNTKGYLLQWFGYQNGNQYLLFDYHWGSNRGSTWMVCWQGFVSLPWFQKLFGVGPDCVAAYLYSVPDISDFLHQLWGRMVVTNAHNEYLNSLLCYGIVGVISWLAVLVGGIRYFYDKAKKNPIFIAFALCITGYACHNIFCYQQVCATPFLFIALGVGESLTKSENFNTIK